MRIEEVRIDMPLMNRKDTELHDKVDRLDRRSRELTIFGIGISIGVSVTLFIISQFS